jgi:hypothetical protein
MTEPVRMTKDLTRRIVEYTQAGQVPEIDSITWPAPLDGREVLCYGWIDDGVGHLTITWLVSPADAPGMGRNAKPVVPAIPKKRGSNPEKYKDWADNENEQ